MARFGRATLTVGRPLSISRPLHTVPRRLMVRLRTLTPSIEVRILVGHPASFLHPLSRTTGATLLEGYLGYSMVDDLLSGMVLDQDVRNESGLLLISRGHEVTLPVLIGIGAAWKAKGAIRF